MQQRVGEWKGRVHAVEIEQVLAVDLQKGAQREEAEDNRCPPPNARAPPPRQRASQRQRRRYPAQEDRIQVTKAGDATIERAQLYAPQLGHQVAAKPGVEHGRRQPAHEVGAQRYCLAPALEREIVHKELIEDGQQCRAPQQHAHAAQYCETRQPNAPAQEQRALAPARVAGVRQQHNQREDGQEERRNHFGQPGEGDEDARKHGRAAACAGAQARVKTAQQSQRVKGNPLRGYHVVVAQRGVDGAVGAIGEDRTGHQRRPPRCTRLHPLARQQPAHEQPRAIAAERRGHEQRDVAGQHVIGGQRQRQTRQHVIEVIGVEDQVDAQRVVDQAAVQGRLKQIKQGVLEVPDVPDKGGFVVGPCGRAGGVRGEVHRQRPPKQRGEHKKAAQHGGMGAQPCTLTRRRKGAKERKSKQKQGKVDVGHRDAG